jgi:hypothetical protein
MTAPSREATYTTTPRPPDAIRLDVLLVAAAGDLLLILFGLRLLGLIP